MFFDDDLRPKSIVINDKLIKLTYQRVCVNIFCSITHTNTYIHMHTNKASWCSGQRLGLRHHSKGVRYPFSSYVHFWTYHIYPTPPLGQDMTQGQFLIGF